MNASFLPQMEHNLLEDNAIPLTTAKYSSFGFHEHIL